MKRSCLVFLFSFILSCFATGVSAEMASPAQSAPAQENLQLAWWWNHDNWCERHPHECHRRWCARHPEACRDKWCARHPEACRARWCEHHPRSCY